MLNAGGDCNIQVGLGASWVYEVQCSLADAGEGGVQSGRVDLSGEHLDATQTFRDRNSECYEEKCFSLKVRIKWFQEASV